MTKKHFIALAETMKFAKPITSDESDKGRQWRKDMELVADFCASQNPAFNRERWIGYIEGRNGPSGGAVK